MSQEQHACAIEQLETRRLLSGNVTASIVNGNLEIWGDNVANEVIVDQLGLAAGQVRIGSGGNLTTVNGELEPVVLDGFVGDVVAWMRHGPDRLAIRDMTLPAGLTVHTGLGIDQVSLMNVIIEGDAEIKTGVRPDTVEIDDSTFNGALLINTRWGRDEVRIEQAGDSEGPRSFFNGPVEIRLSRGDDRLRIGLDADAGNRGVFYSDLLSDGGEHYDELIAGDGNWYDVPPVITNYEYDNIVVPL